MLVGALFEVDGGIVQYLASAGVLEHHINIEEAFGIWEIQLPQFDPEHEVRIGGRGESDRCGVDLLDQAELSADDAEVESV